MMIRTNADTGSSNYTMNLFNQLNINGINDKKQSGINLWKITFEIGTEKIINHKIQRKKEKDPELRNVLEIYMEFIQTV